MTLGTAVASRRRLFLLAGSAIITVLLTWSFWHGTLSLDMAPAVLKIPHSWTSSSSKSPQETLFEQVFSVEDPPAYEYESLAEVCRFKPAAEDSPYLNCTGIWLGLTSIMSQVKVCLKMVVDSGSHMVLPEIAIRHEDDLKNLGLWEPGVVYDKWWDADHLKKVMSVACPQTKIIHPDEIGNTVTVKEHLEVSLFEDFWYQKNGPMFWSGRPFRPWFEEHYAGAQARKLAESTQDAEALQEPGITVCNIDSEFMAFRIMEDPTRNALSLWNDFSRILRFPPAQRNIVHRLLERIGSPYYAVHFRTENDTVWSLPEDQLKRNLETLDQIWEQHGRPASEEKPLVYVSTGDEEEADRFVEGAAQHGWTATHKWALLKDDPETTAMVNALPFDFRGAIDLGIMVKSDFFLGLGGSAMSFTVANYRDPTGHYRGSSLELKKDGGARTHLFHDFDNAGYPCCL